MTGSRRDFLSGYLGYQCFFFPKMPPEDLPVVSPMAAANSRRASFWWLERFFGTVSFTETNWSPRPLPRTLVSTFTGIGNQIAEEVGARAGIDPDVPAGELPEAERTHAAHTFLRLLEDVKAAHFSPAILLRDGTPVEYGVLPFTVWEQLAASDESLESWLIPVVMAIWIMWLACFRFFAKKSL